MSDISASGGGYVDPKALSSKEIQAYKNDFAKSANLFKKALNEYSKTTEIHKKQQLQKTMTEALNVMNQIVKVALKKSGQAKEKKLQNDYNSFVAKKTPQGMKRLSSDIDDVQKSI